MLRRLSRASVSGVLAGGLTTDSGLKKSSTASEVRPPRFHDAPPLTDHVQPSARSRL